MHSFVRRFLPSIAALGLLALCGAAAPFASGQEPYKILDHWVLGGTGGWDYLLADPPAHLLYVTHGQRVEVIDSIAGKPVAQILGLKGTHGIALDADGKYGYISDGGANAVVVFDRHNFHTVASIPAGTNPDGIVFEPVTKTVWAFNGRSKNVTVIDTATLTAVATIDVPGKPEFPQADGRGSVFDNIESENEIVQFDAGARKLIAAWRLTDCESPTGLAIDREHHRLFAVCDGRMAVVDSQTGKQLASPAIGDGPDAANFSVSQQLAFSSNGAGTLSVVDAANGYKTIEELPTARGARTMTYDDLTDRAYLVTAKFGAAPAATEQTPHPRPAVLPDSFEIIVVGR